ncbi:MAG: hypothetical protein LBF06_01780 [Pseudomonas sp.]|jgi:hypothetical protein|nr:hypothetical protein [Pseudomonas sp.]
MKSSKIKLDRHVFELLKDGEYKQFTIRSLMDGYVTHLCGPINDIELWRYIYDQVQRLKRVGWVRQDSIRRRRRDQIFHVIGMPDAVTLMLVDHHFLEGHAEASSDETVDASARTSDDVCPTRRLELLAKEIRLDMLAALGEAERYQQLYTEMPVLKACVEDDYLEARDRSSRLLGHLRAVENTLRLLVAA